MTPAPVRDLTWVDRHKPKHIGEIIGNTDQVRKLAEWLRDWDDVALRGKLKEAPQPKGGWQPKFPVVENVNARAVLVSGPPGIGKTTTCALVARCFPQYKLLEYNASDARGKAIIEHMSQTLGSGHTLRFSPTGKAMIERAVILMDECDGLSGGTDRGGVQALINMIKGTKNPIICICNDRGDQGIRTLVQHCYDLRFRKPENASVAKRLKGILAREGAHLDLVLAESLVEACGQDIRQVINHIQFFGSLVCRTGQKDEQVMLTHFDACSRLLSGSVKQLPLGRRLDMYYVDKEMMPLMIQENYMRPIEKRSFSGKDEIAMLERCAEAAGLIALADSLQMDFQASSDIGLIGTVYPASLMARPGEGFPRATFPMWMQKRAPTVRARTTLQEVHGRIRAATSCSCKDLQISGFLDALHMRMLAPLQGGSARDCAHALRSYGLSKDFFQEQAPLLRAPFQLEDPYRKVEGKIKAVLQQELQSLAQPIVPKKAKRSLEDDPESGPARRRSRGGGEDKAPEAGEEGDEEAPGEDDENSLIKRKKPGGKEVKGKLGKASSKATATVDPSSKYSLAGWKAVKVPRLEGQENIPSRANVDAVLEISSGPFEPSPGAGILLRFIEGHTCAVRRTVHMSDILGEWNRF